MISASYNNRNRNETKRNGIGMQARTIARAAVTQLHQDHESYLGLVSPTLQTRSVIRNAGPFQLIKVLN